MKFDLKKYSKLIEPIKIFSKKYVKWVVAGVVTLIFSFLLLRINYFNTLEPTDQAIDEKIKTLQRPRIDKAIVEKLENLEHDNIQVKSLFNQARDNPFSE